MSATAVMFCLVAIVAVAEPRVVRGIVADESGTPVEGATVVSATDLARMLGTSSATGAFEVTADTPVVVVRKVGFRSAIVRLPDLRGEVRLTLAALPRDGMWAAECSSEGSPLAFHFDPGSNLQRGLLPQLPPGEDLAGDATYWAGRFAVHESRWRHVGGKVSRQLAVAGLAGVHYRDASPVDAWRMDSILNASCLDGGGAKQESFAVVVRDEHGLPIAGATVAHTGFAPVKSQVDGTIRTRLWAPRAVVRKVGHKSAVWDGSASEVTLQRLLPNGGKMPVCGDFARGYAGYQIRIQVPGGAPASKRVQDDDHQRQYYHVDGRNDAFIQHGSGLMWSLGQGPQDREVWLSSRFEERVFDDGGWPLHDYRGRDAKGKYFRQIDNLGEGLSYETADVGLAAAFDQMLDTACKVP